MRAFFWKLRYAIILRNRIKPRAKALWINAGDAWADNDGINTPLEAVDNVLDWEGSARQHNAEVDRQKEEKRQAKLDRQAQYPH